MNSVRFSTYMKNARKTLDIKQKDLAVILGVKQNTLSQWENGKRQKDIRLTTFIGWCQAIKVNPKTIIDWIIGGWITFEKDN